MLPLAEQLDLVCDHISGDHHPFLCWITIVLLSYLPAAQDMTIKDYRSSSLALKKAVFGAAVSMGTVALVTMVFIILNQANGSLVELPSVLKYLAGGLLAFLMNRIENKVNYIIIPSQNKPPIENVEILVISMQERSSKQLAFQRAIRIFGLCLLVGIVIYLATKKTEGISLAINDDNLSLAYSSGDSFGISFNDINSVEETQDLDPGKFISGIETGKSRFGIWENNEFGEYTLCI